MKTTYKQLFATISFFLVAQVAAPLTLREKQGTWDDSSRSVPALLNQMSPSQKVAQLTGKTLFAMADDEELGIPGWLMSDGPHGVHLQDYTSFPTGIAVAAMWDRNLFLRLGHAMGEEFWAAGKHVALAPCMDLCLDPRGGRTAESAGEDPYISGQIGTYLSRGIQQLPVMACLKHFEIEGKQAYRKTCDEIISERDLMGFFGLNFRTAMQDGQALSIMSSYNLVNGVQATANRHLLTDILRTRWGFPFAVISDWEAVKNGTASLLAGTDICMGSVHYSVQLPRALDNGTITEANLDTAVQRVLLAKEVMGLLNWQPGKPDNSRLVDTESHRALCREAAGKAAVLLRNEARLLPLPTSPLRIAVIGPNADAGNLNCFGSSETQPAYAVSLLEGIRNVAPQATVTCIQGCGISGEDTSGFAEALAAAREADIVVFAGGLNKSLEGESIIGVQVQDRKSTALPAIQQQLICQLHEANPRLVVVLQSGGIVSLADCINHIPALLYSFYSGQEAGNGIADVLFGRLNPAGRLPLTMPKDDGQLPEWNDIYFTDDWGGGYRWFQRKGLTPQFPFGYGLSYTTFAYDHLRVVPDTEGLGYTVSADITNTGECDGDEVAQLYIGLEQAPDWQPLLQLRGFERITIPAGKTRTVNFHLTAEDFYEWNTTSDSYEVPAGRYTLCVGPSSAQLPLTTSLDLRALPLQPELHITQLYTVPRYPRIGDEVTFYAYVKNQGTAAAGQWALVVGTEDNPQTALGTSFEAPSYLTSAQDLQPGQGCLIFCTLGSWTPTASGDMTIDATVNLIKENGDWLPADQLATTVHVYGSDSDMLADGIEQISMSEPTLARQEKRGQQSSDLRCFDLAGRRVDTPNLTSRTSSLPKGIYILNGRKYVVR